MPLLYSKSRTKARPFLLKLNFLLFPKIGLFWADGDEAEINNFFLFGAGFFDRFCKIKKRLRSSAKQLADTISMDVCQKKNAFFLHHAREPLGRPAEGFSGYSFMVQSSISNSMTWPVRALILHSYSNLPFLNSIS